MSKDAVQHCNENMRLLSVKYLLQTESSHAIGQPLVIAASRNNPLLNSVAALIFWLMSSSASESILHARAPLELRSYVCHCRLHSRVLQTKLRFQPHTAQFFALLPAWQ